MSYILSMILRMGCCLLLSLSAIAAEQKLKALIVDGVNNHDWAAGTRGIQAILEGSGRFQVDVCTSPCKPEFAKYDVVVNNFNGGHLANGVRWPAETEKALVDYVRGGGGLVIYHAANNAFLNWPEYNDMIGLGWRNPSFGPSVAIGAGGEIKRIPKGQGLGPGHGPRHDFEMHVLDKEHPITRGLPQHWMHPSEQLTHGQHGPAEGLTILTYAFSEISQQGEPMDWIKQYGRGRVYTTMLGHTWKNELNPNLDDVNFQALLARGTEWAATGKVTLPADLGWKPLFNGKDLTGWEVRGPGIWTVSKEGVLFGQRDTSDARWHATASEWNKWRSRHAWLYTKDEFGEYDLHLEFWLPPHMNSGVSVRDRSRAHEPIGETDAERPDLAGFPKNTPSHIGYEIQIIDDPKEKYPTGSIYLFVAAKPGVQRVGDWNSLDIAVRNDRLRVRLNGELVAEGSTQPDRSLTGPIGLQLHDQFTFIQFRNIRIRPVPPFPQTIPPQIP